MGRIKVVVGVLLAVGAIIAIIFFIMGVIGPKNAGILIESDPSSTVFINNEQVGKTPYEATRDAGEVVIKLVPESFDKPLPPFETKVVLMSGAKTIIQRSFGESEDSTSSVIVSFEKDSENASSISIVSAPDNCEVKIDGNVVGFTPYKVVNTSVGEHVISVSANGYEEKNLKVNVFEGYKLTAVFNLKKGGEIIPEQTPMLEQEKEQEEETIQEVEILDTSVGFLRVRKEPSTLAEEVAQVKPGEKYKLLDTDDKTGWFKIEYEGKSDNSEAKVGWVTNQYAKKVTEEEI